MTKPQLLKIFNGWIGRLKLEHYEFEFDFDEAATDSAHASVQNSEHYDWARFRFDPEWITWSNKEANRIAAHELLHVMMRDIDNTQDVLYGQLHKDSMAVWKETFKHAEEGFVDRMAYRLLEVGGCIRP